MKKYDIIIAGSGLGGLQCGYLLAKQGLKVCILEKNARIGGCLQTFERHKAVFDTGFHYVGGLEEGQSLYSLFKYFNLLDLPWLKMDENACEEIILQNQHFYLPNGYERFTEVLTEQFPHNRKEIEKYVQLLQSTGNHLFDSFNRKKSEKFYRSKLFSTSVEHFFKKYIKNPLLRDVLTGNSLKMELSPHLPLYIFAQINNSFVQSAWKLDGGGSLIAQHLADDIQKMGGEVHTHAEVTQFVENNGVITKVSVNKGEYFLAGDIFIADIHPQTALGLLKNTLLIRPIYRHRINRLNNSFGAFTVHLEFTSDEIKPLNRTLYIYPNNVSPIDANTLEINKLLVHFYPPSPKTRIDLITPVLWKEVEPFANSTIVSRSEQYYRWKEQKAKQCISILRSILPFSDTQIANIYTSSPLTWRDYTGTANGSAYGILKDADNLLKTMLPAKTPLCNLFFTGQNLNLHGVLGVSMTSLLTVAQFSDIGKALKEITDI
ncbi:MAG: NAD(P)/FAD-dependent oxidoreductase [Bacteroidales bacterium]|jgi:all-trans-retinol 13,14-reductase|nr:NAD(P)/FAD-dependent oxidoreductase [Bacteroidales bacterium]